MEIQAYQDLRCPQCAGELGLRPFTTEQEEGREYVKEGALLCDRCRVLYPIEADTPVMLRFSTPFHDWFAQKHAAELAAFSDYSSPRGEARTGEEAVQETFTDEWDLTRENELSFSYTQEQLVELNRNCWLRHLVSLPADEKPHSLLNVGCGVGMETVVLKDVTGAQRVIGMDLNFAVLNRRPEFRRLPGINFVVASLFDLPFAPESFDMVYSQGVIHHTYSTTDAFKSISTRVDPRGYLFVWVYGLEDHLTAFGSRRWARRHHFAEWVSRPWISQSPRPIRNFIFKVLTLGSHLRPRGPSNARMGKLQHGDKWTRANTEHAVRDWLSPRYARRHGFNEVTEWFEDAGFEIVDVQSSREYRKLFNIPLFGIGMTGRRSAGAGGAESATEQPAAEVSRA